MTDLDDEAFLRLVEPHRDAVRLHCYRMLGSSHDAEDVLQQTLVRAWRAKSTLADPERVRPWLYRIATNECLDELQRRPRRALATDAYPPEAPRWPAAPPIEEPVWLEPAPDAWLRSAPDADATYTLKESVALAFVAALQILSPPQRATLLLRDVLGLSAEETAEALGVSVSAANSALFRARSAVEAKIGDRDAFAASAGEVDAGVLERWVRAFEASDVEALVALLHDDVVTTMPPSPTWIAGRADNEAFYRAMMAPHARGVTRVVAIRANGQPAFAFYRAGAGEPHLLRAIHLAAVRDGRIARVDHFMMPELFAVFGLPRAIGAPSAG